jgi:recombination protein RecT
MANEVTTAKPKFSVTLTNELTSQIDALPRDFNITRFVNNSLALLNGNDVLIKFMREHGTDQIKVGLLRGAYLGLDFMNGEAYLVPYGATLNFMPSYKGMVKLCTKYATRPINTIYAKVVKEGDEFVEEIVNGQPSITFRPKAFNNGKMVGVFAVCLYKDGGMVYEVMSSADVEQCRKSSKASNSPAWRSYPGEMAKKTVLRRLAKSISIDMDDKLADAMNAGLEIETDPAKIAERETAENGNSEELVVEAAEVSK